MVLHEGVSLCVNQRHAAVDVGGQKAGAEKVYRSAPAIAILRCVSATEADAVGQFLLRECSRDPALSRPVERRAIWLINDVRVVANWESWVGCCHYFIRNTARRDWDGSAGK
jgi:hypothetical protein